MDRSVFDPHDLPRTYLRLALPLVLGMIVTMVYNITDTWFVSATGNTSLVAGVSLCAPVFMLLMAIGNIFGQGGSSLISRLLGAGRVEDVRRVSSFCFYAAIFSGIAIGAALLLLRGPALQLLGADGSTLPHASGYFTWFCAGAPFCVLNFIHMNLLRTEGMSKESMIGTVGGAVVNIILDPIFISVLGLGARGAAIASVLGYLLSDVYGAVIVVRRSRFLSILPPDARVSRGHAGQIFAIGISAALSNIMASLSMVLLNRFLLPYGEERIAAMGIASRVSSVVSLILTGMAFGAAPMFGRFYGAGDYDTLRRLIRWLSRVLAGTALVLTAIVVLAAPALMRGFLRDPAVVGPGTVMLRLLASGSVFAALILMCTVLAQSVGSAGAALFLSVSRQGVVFIAVLLVLSALLGYEGVILSQLVADVLSLAAAAAITLRMVRSWKE